MLTVMLTDRLARLDQEEATLEEMYHRNKDRIKAQRKAINKALEEITPKLDEAMNQIGMRVS